MVIFASPKTVAHSLKLRFGSCFEGGCGYAAIFVGFPLITLVLTVVGCVIWFVLRRRG